MVAGSSSLSSSSVMPRTLALYSSNIFRRIKGKNLFGKIGLFPQSYTTSDATVLQPQPTPQNGAQPVAAAPPQAEADTFLQTLREESNSAVSTPNGQKSTEDNDGVMRATLTDVQEAIEQLGRNNRDGNGSFSFASSRATNSDHETDTEGAQSNDENGESWHKGARSNLAEKARKQQELLRKEQEAYDEELRRHAPVLTEQISEPPIEFEMSDESEDEHEHGLTTNTPFGRREHAHISEEEEDEDQVPLKVLKDTNARPTTPKTAKPAPQRSHIDLSNQWTAVTDNSMDPPPETARQQHFTPAAAPNTNGVSEAKAMNGDASIKPFLQASEVCHF